MRKVSVAAAVLAVLSIAACEKKQVVVDDGLAKDLALASSSEGLAMAPSGPGQKVESAIEQLPYGRVAHAHVKMPHRAPLLTEQPSPQVAITPVSSTLPLAPAPVLTAPRPRPVDVSYPVTHRVLASDGPTDGSSPDGVQPGPSRGGWGAIIRGGVADGDHCDPRGGISINNRMPGIHGTF